MWPSGVVIRNEPSCSEPTKYRFPMILWAGKGLFQSIPASAFPRPPPPCRACPESVTVETMTNSKVANVLKIRIALQCIAQVANEGFAKAAFIVDAVTGAGDSKNFDLGIPLRKLFLVL